MSTSELNHAGLPTEQIQALVSGRHGEPFAVLGQHAAGTDTVVRSLQPQATAVTILAEDGRTLPMSKLHDDGLFATLVPKGAGRYHLLLDEPGGQREIIDPYSLPPALGELDRYLFAEGTHLDLYKALGAHAVTHEGVPGVRFAVWAPNASRVGVVGDFNSWDGRRHVMRKNFGSGVWDLFVPELGEGTLYKFELIGPDDTLLPLKHDPFGQFFEQAPANAAIVFNSRFQWHDGDWLKLRAAQDPLRIPISIYELHPASWRRHDDGRVLNYAELADQLIPYMLEQGFTHIELLPVSEHPFSGSWGYQPIGLFAPTSRFGSPDDFRQLVDRCHTAGIGVIIDWVPAHFPTDAHGLGQYDGTHLYEHADPRQGVHRDWDTLIFNYGRREVCNYLLSNALYWLREFHIDGLRVDAVASMLYLDYSREPGDWIPNQQGGRENLEAIDFLQRMNTLVHAEGGITFAEESTSFPGVSHPVYAGGLGFTFKWNMGWMHDILQYLAHEPVHRPWHHNQLTFGLLYAFSENFILPLSHDEVVHGKGSLLNKMPGDRWQQHANLRLLYTFMHTYPGKKLLFMGAEIAQPGEWAHDGSLDWCLLEHAPHAGTGQLVADLNHLYREQTALYSTDCDGSGFAWISCDDADQSVVAFERRSADGSPPLVAIFNFTPVVREAYRLGVPRAGVWREAINSDADAYAGSNVGNTGAVQAEPVPDHGQDQSLVLTLPPLGALVLVPAV